MADRDRDPGAARGPRAARGGRGVQVALVAGAALGGLLLLLAEVTSLYTIHMASRHAPVRSIGTGSHDSWALVPVALLVLILAYGLWRTGNRSALLAIGMLGVLVLLIGLLHDLPDARQSGLLQTAPGRCQAAGASPSAGLYMETLAGVILLMTSVSGFLLTSPPTRRAVPLTRPADG
jgi:hypothetical protein